MAFQKFNEYMNSKGNIDKAKIVPTGDNIDVPKDRSTNPPKSEKAMKTNDEGGKVKKEMTAAPKPYTSKGHKTLDRWDNVNPELKYEPDTSTEAFIDKTKDMNMPEFVKFVSGKYSISEKKLQKAPTISTPNGDYLPMPHENISLTRFLILNNEAMMESFVRDVKRHNGIDALVRELLKHPEAYSELAEAMGDDESVSKKLTKCLKLAEMVSIPRHKDMPKDLNMGGDDDDDMGMGMGHGHDDDMDDDDMGDDDDMDSDDDMGDDDDMDSDDMDSDDDMGDDDDDMVGPDDDDMDDDHMRKHMMKKKKRPMGMSGMGGMGGMMGGGGQGPSMGGPGMGSGMGM